MTFFGEDVKILVFFLSVTFALSSYANDVQKVYRADMARPEAVKADHGFLPRGMDGSRPNQPPPNINLFDHVRGAATGMSRHDSGYVSTTSSRGVAINWVRDHLNNNGYVYHIDPTSNFIDVNATLLSYTPHREELEFAALGIIHWSQIIGWESVDSRGIGVYTPNPDYNGELYSMVNAAGAVPELAGFPAGHPAWEREPWLQFANCGSGLRLPCQPVKTAQQVGVKWFKKSQKEIRRQAFRLLSAALIIESRASVKKDEL
ncbi:enterotoxin A family protein [Aeromonas veronii]|uniref:enterotoxin A family protein n=1 Tax=Aeromonas TaxID=642 RepID=UPI001C24798E|nr:enterotoxin A family protein [Aeromonas sp. FDAARGOS 1416]QXB01789.1 enterotoxin A family protein [Aeromonas sp. FDAARGOS 1416]